MVDVKFKVVVDDKDFCAEMLRIACDVSEHDVVRCTAINALTKLANVSLIKELELNYSVDTQVLTLKEQRDAAMAKSIRSAAKVIKHG